MKRQLHLVWFCHQPFFVPDEEILWRVNSSYVPLLDALSERRIPFSFAMSGSLLRRVAELSPYCVDAIQAYSDAGLLSMVGTAACHPILPWLTNAWAREQLESDKRARAELQLPSSDAFWPTELAWSMRVGKAAADAGYHRAFVDSRCCDLADTAPDWTYAGGRLLPDLRAPKRAGRFNRLQLSSDNQTKPFELWVRDASLAHAFIAALRTDEPDERCHLASFLEALDTVRGEAADPDAPVMLADDAERFLPDGLARFLDLLDGLLDSGVEFCSASRFAEVAPCRTVDYVPAGTMEADDALWNQSPDDRWFRESLDRAADRLASRVKWNGENSHDREWIDRMLRIQDSSFYFWRYISRTRRPFYDELFKIEAWLDV